VSALEARSQWPPSISEVTKAHGRGKFLLLYELVFSIDPLVSGLVDLIVIPRLG